MNSQEAFSRIGDSASITGFMLFLLLLYKTITIELVALPRACQDRAL